MTTTPTNDYVAAFEAAADGLPGHGLAWLESARRASIDHFAATGFPTPKTEAWKFTNLRALTRKAMVPAARHGNAIARGDLAGFTPAGLDCHSLVFVDGHFRADLSDIGALPDGVRLCSLAEVLASAPELVEAHLAEQRIADSDGPLALNTAFMADGAVLVLDRGASLERPVHLIYVATVADASTHMRSLIDAAAGSSATVIESYVAIGDGAYWTNAVTDVVAARDAAINHVKLETEGDGAFHLAKTRVRLAQGSAYRSFVAAIGGRLARNEIDVSIDGPGVDCRLDGIYLARRRQHIDNTTVVDHRSPGSYSNERYKGVVDDAGHGVFQGKIIVRPDAQKTDAHQLNKNLLLSETAQVDTKPELEIHADDVQCSHGAATGQLDANAMFYLRSRGLSPDMAQRILVEAFIGEMVDAVEHPALKAHLAGIVAGWLSPI